MPVTCENWLTLINSCIYEKLHCKYFPQFMTLYMTTATDQNKHDNKNKTIGEL